MKNFLLGTLCILGLFACNDQKVKHHDQTHFTGHEQFLSSLKNDSLKARKALHEITEDSNFLQMLARVQELQELFELTGNVDYLNEATNLQEKVVDKIYIKREKQLRALAQLYIKQHRFQQADSTMNVSMSISESRQNKLVAFDVAMELGEYKKAANILTELHKPNDFNYLVRAAKWKDHTGALESTIDLMLKAEKLAESEGNAKKLEWVYTNLGDYYGHNNEIEKSYDYYMKALLLNSKNVYALHKIAYILYSSNKAYDEALTVLESLQQINTAPDLDLLKAEIYSMDDQQSRAEEAMDQFYHKVNTRAYGNMYNGHLIEYYCAVGKDQKALELAKREVNNRSTPETYSWLALAHLASGNNQEAFDIIEHKVWGKTHEPTAMIISGKVFKSQGHTDKVEKIKSDLSEASFELGPLTMREVEGL